MQIQSNSLLPSLEKIALVVFWVFWFFSFLFVFLVLIVYLFLWLFFFSYCVPKVKKHRQCMIHFHSKGYSLSYVYLFLLAWPRVERIPGQPRRWCRFSGPTSGWVGNLVWVQNSKANCSDFSGVSLGNDDCSWTLLSPKQSTCRTSLFF